ncbi:hypothetical protein CFR71_05005 [Novacetimonas pomaceti]|uniref:Uncharacterized protein n=1 Tax=Novacetimonas pomaceti TaxID=2021998 RepID=A0A318QFR5_9PROT|nr:hypothetical protein CFR71_05005 [Novacetimonas pomaceti]
METVCPVFSSCHENPDDIRQLAIQPRQMCHAYRHAAWVVCAQARRHADIPFDTSAKDGRFYCIS